MRSLQWTAVVASFSNSSTLMTLRIHPALSPSCLQLKKGSEDIRDYFDRAGGVGTSFLAKVSLGPVVSIA